MNIGGSVPVLASVEVPVPARTFNNHHRDRDSVFHVQSLRRSGPK